MLTFLTKAVDAATLERLLVSKLWSLVTTKSVGGKYDAISQEADVELAYTRLCLTRLITSDYCIL